MDIKDLMVGNWVYVSGKPVKITKDDLATMLIFLDDDSKINPIPLTEEILVKNGFKKESQTIDGDYCKYTLPGFALNWCDTDGFWYQNGDITPNHVHTLQHLLRLAGVQKEIELWQPT